MKRKKQSQQDKEQEKHKAVMAKLREELDSIRMKRGIMESIAADIISQKSEKIHEKRQELGLVKAPAKSSSEEDDFGFPRFDN